MDEKITGEDEPFECDGSVFEGAPLRAVTIVDSTIRLNSSATISGQRAVEGDLGNGWAVVRENRCQCGACAVNEHGFWYGNYEVLDRDQFFGRQCRDCECYLGNAGWHELGYLLRPNPAP